MITDALTSHSDPHVISEFYSDHLPLRFTFYKKIHSLEPIPISCYHLANWNKFREILEIALGPLAATEHDEDKAQIDYLVMHLTDCILHARERSIPNRKTNKDHIFVDLEL